MKKSTIRKLVSFLCVIMIMGRLQGLFLAIPQVSAAAELKIPAKMTATNVNVRKTASRSADIVLNGKTKIQLNKNTAVTVLAEKTSNGEKWYQISFKINGATKKGYVLSDYVKLTLKTHVPATISSKTAVNIRTGAGTSKTYLKVSNKVVSLKTGTDCTILKESTVAGRKWFQVQFLVNKKIYKGYLLASQIAFQLDTPIAVAKTGHVTASSLNVRTAAGTDQSILKYEGANVKLTKGQSVTIKSEKKVGSVIWYQVSFTYQKKSLTGYVSGEYIETTNPTNSPKPTSTPKPTKTPKPTNTLEPSSTPKPTQSPEDGVTSTETPEVMPTETPIVTNTPFPTSTPVPSEIIPLSDEEFEQALNTEGFPEDYKGALRLLHKQYPLWQFKANHTGLEWNVVIKGEAVVGKNLITNAKADAWKSFEKGAYNWETDKFIPFDSTTWVTASKEAIEYYMDPRNFLTTDGIFQFEELSFSQSHQNVQGVESILKGTPLSNAAYSYTDRLGENQTLTYGETFIKAAHYALVNPYHLATRVKQEVITSSGLSNSAAGSVSGYEGIYNFYNIGASHSTTSGGNILNALNFAKNGTGLTAANKTAFLIPWNNPYNAIVGGAKYIGSNYINRGQNTVYLQKFNLTSNDRYNHQYMANVEAPKAEAQKTYHAYRSMTDVPVVFVIPVFHNMPAIPCPIPTGMVNPNNWLKVLEVEGYSLTPAFSVSNVENTIYTLEVPNEVEQITITAQPVSAKATISGADTVIVEEGINTYHISVVSQIGTERVYTIQVNRAIE